MSWIISIGIKWCGGHCDIKFCLFSSTWSSMQRATPHTMKSSRRNESGQSIPTAPVLKTPSTKFPLLCPKTSEKCKSQAQAVFFYAFLYGLLFMNYGKIYIYFILSKCGSCLTENIHKDFRKAIGANCIFYSASTQQLIVLVSDLFLFYSHFVMQKWALLCVTVSVCFSSVYKWVHSEASSTAERHALPEYSYQTHVDVPQWGGHQTLRGA